MNRLSRPATLALALLAAILGGCSQGRELSTKGQAAGFVVQVAGGESAGDWSLESKPTEAATQAWAERDTIADLGQRLRSEGSKWACEFINTAIGLGSLGYFNEDDAGIMTKHGQEAGIGDKRFAPLLHDIITLRYRDLVLAATSICGPYKVGT